MKKITLLFIGLLTSLLGISQVNVDLANAIQIESFPYTDPAVNIPNGTQEEGSAGCNANVATVDYKFKVVTGGTVTVTLSNPTVIGEPYFYYASSINETDPAALTISDNLGNVGVECDANDPGPDGTRTAIVNDGDIIFVLITNDAISDIVFSGTATLSPTMGVNDKSLIQVSVYPNPVMDLLNIKLPAGTVVTRSKLYDMLGRDTRVKLNKGTMDVAYLSKGIYILTIETTLGSYSTRILKR